MPLELLFATSFLVGLTGAMVPGSLFTVTVAETARHGFRAGPLLVLGHGVLEIVLLFALAAGLAGLLVRDGVTAVIAVAGGAFLIWMGGSIARDTLRGRLELAVAGDLGSGLISRPAAAPGNASRLVGLGIMVSLSNPYFLLWWATIGLGYITLALERGTLGLAAFFTGHILSDLVWYSLVAGAVTGSKRLLTPGIYRGLLMVCGSFLVLLGGYFIYSGLVKNLGLG